MYQFDTESSVENARAVTSGPNQRSSDPTYILPVSNKSFYFANSIKYNITTIPTISNDRFLAT